MTAQTKLQAYFDAILHNLQETVPVPLTTTINKVSEGRRLLALRGYLRYPNLTPYRGTMEENWAWEKDKEDAFNKSPKKPLFDAEVAKVKKEFRRLMPGYYLTGEVKARNLQRQIHHWNHNDHVSEIAKTLKHKALHEIARKSKGDRSDPGTVVYADDPAPDDLARFSEWLSQDGLVKSPTNATPGLSDHGQAKAIDFTVWKKAETKTDKDVEVAKQVSETMQTVWKDPGFSEALKKATRGTKLSGPLAAPPEDWHYTFIDAD